jgi:uncharacterized protein
MRQHQMSTNKFSIRHAILPCVLAFGFAGATMQAQTTNSTTTNLPPATPTLAATNGITLSNYKHPLTDVRRMNRRDDPKSSRDRHFDWWPRFGSTQQGTNDWIQYNFAEPAKVSESKVYWFQDIPTGGCAVPVSWSLLYQDGEQWKPVETAGAYTVSTNAYDSITFKPVTTTALRMEIKFQNDYSVGMEAWKLK